MTALQIAEAIKAAFFEGYGSHSHANEEWLGSVAKTLCDKLLDQHYKQFKETNVQETQESN